MAAAEFAELVADISANGQRELVWTHNGLLIDGRHRWDACEQLGIPCHSREYDGYDVLGFVVSLNLRRRHLSDDQRAIVAANIATLPHGIRADRVEAQIAPVTQR
jgi:ParB-like chromosome segregation protein Spo0J